MFGSVGCLIILKLETVRYLCKFAVTLGGILDCIMDAKVGIISGVKVREFKISKHPNHLPLPLLLMQI